MYIIQGTVDATIALAQVALAIAISPTVTLGIGLAGGVLLGGVRPLL